MGYSGEMAEKSLERVPATPVRNDASPLILKVNPILLMHASKKAGEKFSPAVLFPVQAVTQAQNKEER